MTHVLDGGVTVSWCYGLRRRITSEKRALIRCGCRTWITDGRQAGDTMLRPAGPGVAPGAGPPR